MAEPGTGEIPTNAADLTKATRVEPTPGHFTDTNPDAAEKLPDEVQGPRPDVNVAILSIKQQEAAQQLSSAEQQLVTLRSFDEKTHEANWKTAKPADFYADIPNFDVTGLQNNVEGYLSQTGITKKAALMDVAMATHLTPEVAQNRMDGIAAAYDSAAKRHPGNLADTLTDFNSSAEFRVASLAANQQVKNTETQDRKNTGTFGHLAGIDVIAKHILAPTSKIQ